MRVQQRDGGEETIGIRNSLVLFSLRWADGRFLGLDIIKETPRADNRGGGVMEGEGEGWGVGMTQPIK